MNVSILGTGRIAHKMAETAMVTEGATLYAVASRTIEKAEVFKDEFNMTVCYGSYGELAKDKDAGLVYIATPHMFHYENAKMMLENGHNVLCEKPITINKAQAEELFEIAKSKGLFIIEAMWARFFPIVKRVKEILESGIIGKPMILDAKFGFYGLDKPRLTEPDLGGGALLDLGIYPLNTASVLFGNDFTGVTTEGVLTQKGVDRQNYTVLKYEDGRRALLTSSIDTKFDNKSIIYCQNGYIEITGAALWRKVKVYNSDYELLERIVPAYKTGYEYELSACIKAIENGKIECDEVTHEQTLFMMGVMDELREKWGLKYPGE